MYAARTRILELTGRTKLDDRYFTQTLLPDYIEEHPAASTWDVVFDDRGTLIEPHTDRSVPLGTLEVRGYLEGRPVITGTRLALNPGLLLATRGPEHRYSSILFIEKEGFNPLLAKARIAERFDIAISAAEIRFLRHRRVELNAMPADVFVQFLERKLAEHGIGKVVPGDAVLEQHARHVLTRALANRTLDGIGAKAKSDAAAIALPAELRQQVVADLRRQPDLPWDLAVADIARGALKDGGAQ